MGNSFNDMIKKAMDDKKKVAAQPVAQPQQAMGEEQEEMQDIPESMPVLSKACVHKVSSLLLGNSGGSLFMCGLCGLATYVPEQDKWIPIDSTFMQELQKAK